MKQVIRSPFDRLWRNKDLFAEVFALQGEVFRNVKNRRTFRFEAEGRGFFIKIHRGIGWKEIFKNLLQFKIPVTGAANEFYALEKLHALNVPTMTAAAFAERGSNPAAKESFLITEELVNVISLEELAQKFPLNGAQRIRLIRALADSAGTMHRAGINHRDCYICHYLLDKATLDSAQPVLYVIDLHRAQLRKKVPYRYHVKDVAGLLFSAWSANLTRQEAWRFLRRYSRESLRRELSCNGGFWRDVVRTAAKLYRKENSGKEPPQIF